MDNLRPLLKLKACRSILALKDVTQEWYISKLAGQSEATYVFTTCLVRKLQNLGLVECKPKGRAKMVKLTEKGMSLANSLEDMVKLSELPPDKSGPIFAYAKKAPTSF